MTDQEIQDRLEKICEDLVLAEPSDLGALADLHTRIEAVGRWAADALKPEAASAAAACAALIEKVVLEEVPDPEAALLAVGRTISSLQVVLRDGRDPRELAFPSLAGIEGAPGKGSVQERPPARAAPELLEDFIAEATEQLDAVEIGLLALEKDPARQEELNAVFRAFHNMKGNAGCLGLPAIQSLAHQGESLLDLARQGKLSLEGEALEAAFEAVDAMKEMIGRLGTAPSTAGEVEGKDSLADLLRRIESLVGAPAVQVETARAVPREARMDQRLPVPIKDSIRVDAVRLDRLLDAIGELVIVESTIGRIPGLRDRQSSSLARGLHRLDTITRQLQDLGTSLRMVPVRQTFQRMARLARDLAKKMKKPVQFIASGEETELDKTMVDRIGDPLMHLIRNAIDHGIEPSQEERLLAGKPKTASVHLRAFHRGSKIQIEVEDDGKGIDREGVVARARERGLLRPGEIPADREVLDLLFAPGLSTAREITDVSGRGVGLDVVKRNVEALQGQVEVSTRPGKGSVFSLRLPLTLAIIDGMVIRLGHQRYILPTLSVIRSIRATRMDLSTALEKGEMLRVEGSLVPLFRLGRILGIEGAEEDPTQAVSILVESDHRRAGLLVDEILGREQIVIKSLGAALEGIPGISGGAFLPEGEIGLILDVGGLMDLARSGAHGCEVHQPLH